MKVAWAKFALAHKIIQAADAEARLVKYAADSDMQVRRDTASSALLATRIDQGADWPVILLLQLAKDHEPSVRAAAVQHLANVSQSLNLRLQPLIKDTVRVRSVQEQALRSYCCLSRLCRKWRSPTCARHTATNFSPYRYAVSFGYCSWRRSHRRMTNLGQGLPRAAAVLF